MQMLGTSHLRGKEKEGKEVEGVDLRAAWIPLRGRGMQRNANANSARTTQEQNQGCMRRYCHITRR
jgi:hypothetical protein